MKFQQVLFATSFAASLALAQQPDSTGFKRMSDFNDGQAAPSATQVRRPQAPALTPSVLTVPRGTYFTIRTTQVLSSNQNRPGDEFTANLVKPIIVNGVIIADRGQIVGGRVVEAVKAGMIKGQSRLAITLTELTLADGTQVPFHSQLTGFSGGTSIGRDATAVAVPAGIGAAVGGVAAGGAAAGIGAAAGAGAGLIGVLLTRGNPTVIYPESVLTFRVEDPIEVATDRAPQAFRMVGHNDYSQPTDQPRPTFTQRPPSYFAPSYGYGGYGGYGGYYGPRYFYGPRIAFGGGYRGYGRRR